MPAKFKAGAHPPSLACPPIRDVSTRSTLPSSTAGPGCIWRCGARLRSYIAGITLSSVPTGLSKVSLKFTDPSLEQAYVLSRAAELQLEAIRFSFAEIAICVTAVIFWELLEDKEDRSDILTTLSRVRQGVLAGLALCGSILILLFQSSWFMRTTSPLFREVFAAAMLILHIPAFALTDVYYMAKLLGHSDPAALWDREHHFSDSRVLMCVVAVIIVSHLLPIRWCILAAVEIFSFIFYIVIVIALESPEGDYATANCCLLVCSAFLACLGKRRAEASDRLLFTNLVKEHRLRCEKEFELTLYQARNPLKRASTGCDSVATADTAHLFQSELASPGAAAHEEEHALERMLMKIADLGHKEHWLISATEVRLQPKNIIGSGGFGVVVAATYHGSTVAVKLPRSARFATKMQHLPPMVNELRVLRHLRHPHIVLFFGACINPGTGELMLVFEWVRGSPLDRFLGRPPENPDTTSRYQILLDVCCALRYLHAQDPLIVHGDLKASNILIEDWSQGPRAKLIDFGLSRLMSQRLTMPLGGSLHWVAPEVVQDPTRQPSPHADTFSFGRLVFFTITGRMPLKQFSKREIIEAARDGDVPPLQWPTEDSEEDGADDILFVPALLAEGQAICEKCLQADPQRRPKMSAVHSEISDWSLPNPVHAQRLDPSTGRRLGGEWAARDDEAAHVDAAEAVPHWQACVRQVRDNLPPPSPGKKILGKEGSRSEDDDLLPADQYHRTSSAGEVVLNTFSNKFGHSPIMHYFSSSPQRSPSQHGTAGPRWLGLGARSRKPRQSVGLSSMGSERAQTLSQGSISEENVPSERSGRLSNGPPPSSHTRDKASVDGVAAAEHSQHSSGEAVIQKESPGSSVAVRKMLSKSPSDGYFAVITDTGTEPIVVQQEGPESDRGLLTQFPSRESVRAEPVSAIHTSTLSSDSSFRWAVP